jgi:FPC/CPF motif-containing protein YcgG
MTSLNPAELYMFAIHIAAKKAAESPAAGLDWRQYLHRRTLVTKTTIGNPHSSEDAIANSCYTKLNGETLVIAESGEPAPALADRVHAALRALILDPEYPCVGSRSALNQGSYRFAMYDELATPEATAGLARDLYTFVQEQPSIEGEFTTFVACFDKPKALSPEEWEDLLWKQLSMLSQADTETWSEGYSDDPQDNQFAFSFAGKAFFVAGLSPAGERWARTFPWPLLAFNAHFQFEQLRADGRFEKIRDTVRERDAQVEGEENANVEDFGTHTEARQYAGRSVPDDWRCPVSFNRQ